MTSFICAKFRMLALLLFVLCLPFAAAGGPVDVSDNALQSWMFTTVPRGKNKAEQGFLHYEQSMINVLKNEGSIGGVYEFEEWLNEGPLYPGAIALGSATASAGAYNELVEAFDLKHYRQWYQEHQEWENEADKPWPSEQWKDSGIDKYIYGESVSSHSGLSGKTLVRALQNLAAQKRYFYVFLPRQSSAVMTELMAIADNHEVSRYAILVTGAYDKIEDYRRRFGDENAVAKLRAHKADPSWRQSEPKLRLTLAASDSEKVKAAKFLLIEDKSNPQALKVLQGIINENIEKSSLTAAVVLYLYGGDEQRSEATKFIKQYRAEPLSQIVDRFIADPDGRLGRDLWRFFLHALHHSVPNDESKREAAKSLSHLMMRQGHTPQSICRWAMEEIEL